MEMVEHVGEWGGQGCEEKAPPKRPRSAARIAQSAAIIAPKLAEAPPKQRQWIRRRLERVEGARVRIER